MSTDFSLAPLVMLIATLAPSSPAHSGPEVRMVEDKRPEDSRRLASGRCDHHTYEVEVATGRPISTSILDARVDHRSRMGQLRQALAALPNSALAISDVFIDRCGGGRARLQLDVLQKGEPPNVHHYYLWLGDDGSVEFMGER